MHLEQQPRPKALRQLFVQANHGHLDNVGRRALDGVIDRLALGALHGLAVGAAHWRLEDGEVAAAAEERLHVAVGASLVARLIQVALDAGELGKVLLDERLRLAQRQAALARQTEGTHAIDQPKVDPLGEVALILTDALRRDAIDDCRCGRVDVLLLAKGVEHCRILGDVGQDAQFNLRVVGRQEHPARVADEATPDLLADFAADGDVLQVGVAAGQPARHGPDLAEAGVDAARLGVDHLGQRVHVSTLQLAQFAVLDDGGDDAAGVGGAQPFQHVGGRRIVAAGDALQPLAWQLELLEQDVAELLRRVNVERFTGDLVDGRF